jgi:hypothetical protein
MDSFALYHFSVTRNNRICQMLVQPGTPWEEVDAFLEEFKAGFAQQRADAEERERKAKEESPITPEVVS